MTRLEREIKRRLDELTEILLKGDAPDFTAYRVAAARRQELLELVEFVAEARKSDQGDSDDDE